jgi:hypothetical protein
MMERRDEAFTSVFKKIRNFNSSPDPTLILIALRPDLE